MFKIEKRFTVPIGHRLSKHKGLCSNIHGHNLIILVGIKSSLLNDNYMVMDFSDLKIEVKKILDTWDHTLIVNRHDNCKGLSMMKEDMRVMGIIGDPTAENLSIILYNSLEIVLKKDFDVDIDYVTIYENENSKATYSKD